MKFSKYILPVIIFACSLGMLPQSAIAQTSIGASYEIRDEEPENGFGLRLERQILGQLPVVDLGLRAHFSYFSEDNYVGENNFNYGEVENYDYGLAALGGVSLGLLSPYVGLGLGASTLEVEQSDVQNAGDSDSSIYWNGFVGAKVSPIPNIKPFVEYRFEDISDYDDVSDQWDKSSGRLIFGVSLSF